MKDILGTHKTTVRRKDGVLSVVYHATEVVRVEHKRVTLDSGGWETHTTKNRMNQASKQFDLGFTVFQKAFQWYVDIGEDKPLDFEDGIQFTSCRLMAY